MDTLKFLISYINYLDYITFTIKETIATFQLGDISLFLFTNTYSSNYTSFSAPHRDNFSPSNSVNDNENETYQTYSWNEFHPLCIVGL